MIKKSFLFLSACTLVGAGIECNHPAMSDIPHQQPRTHTQPATADMTPPAQIKRSLQQLWEKLIAQKPSKDLQSAYLGCQYYYFALNVRNKSAIRKESEKINKSPYLDKPLTFAGELAIYQVIVEPQFDGDSCSYRSLFNTNIIMDDLARGDVNLAKKEKASDTMSHTLNDKNRIQKVFGKPDSPWKEIVARPRRHLIDLFRKLAYANTCKSLGIDHKINFENQPEETKKLITDCLKEEKLPLPVDPGDESDLSPQLKRSVSMCSTTLLSGDQIEYITEICKSHKGTIRHPSEDDISLLNLVLPQESQINPNHHIEAFDLLPGQIDPITEQPFTVDPKLWKKIESLKKPGIHGIIVRTDSTSDVSHWISVVINRQKGHVDYVIADSLNHVKYANSQLKRLIKLVEGERIYTKYEAELSKKPSFFYTITHLL